MNRLKIQKMTMGVTQPTNNEGREKLSEFHTLRAGRTEFSPKSTRKKHNIIKSEQTFIPSNFFQFHRIFGITFDFFRLLKLIPFYSCSISFAICASMYVCMYRNDFAANAELRAKIPCLCGQFVATKKMFICYCTARCVHVSVYAYMLKISKVVQYFSCSMPIVTNICRI